MLAVIEATVWCAAACTQAAVAASGRVVTIDKHHRLVVDAKPVFPIIMSPGPPLNARAPNGGDALDELKSGGANMLRLGLFNDFGYQEFWNSRTEELLGKYLDWAHAHDFLAAVNLQKLSVVEDPNDENAKHLRAFLSTFARHPAVAVWKTMDEPQWGKIPLDSVANAHKLIKQLDPNHQCWMNQAPRGTLEEVAAYNKHCDIAGLDIYPVSVPMGKHSHLPNKNLSVVGDYVKWISESVDGKKPIWMVLQISFSGAVPPKPVIFPTLEQERYMVYQAIITGARGLLFFGGANILEGRDKELGWNWTFWSSVLKPVLAEITEPEMKQVLLAAASPRRIVASGADDVELAVREIGERLYILAAKREGAAAKVRLEGLPSNAKEVDVLFEDRSISTSGGAFVDEFKPNAVHVYRIAL